MYYFVVMLVHYIDAVQLVERLQKDNYVSADHVREQRRRQSSYFLILPNQSCSTSPVQRSSEDDDIIVSQTTISLKCPVRAAPCTRAPSCVLNHAQLSHAHIATPVRSEKCNHPSCFDAISWFSVNEQTSTWSCPICDKPINQEDLIVDG